MTKYVQEIAWGDRRPTLGGVIGSWSAYVSQIAADMAEYPAEVIGIFGYDDFIGALFTRNALERGMRQLSVSDQDAEFYIVKTVDEYFQSLTRDDPGRLVGASEPLFAGLVDDDSYWWLRRIPKDGALGYEVARSVRTQSVLGNRSQCSTRFGLSLEGRFHTE